MTPGWAGGQGHAVENYLSVPMTGDRTPPPTDSEPRVITFRKEVDRTARALHLPSRSSGRCWQG